MPKNSAIFTAKDLESLDQVFDKIQEGDIVFLDVDDNLITPVDPTFRPQSPYHNLIDFLKKNKQTSKNDYIADRLSVWRSNRQVQLLSPKWPDIITKLKQKGALVYGLTQIQTGSVGRIASMEEWRYAELMRLGIEFSPTFEGREKINNFLDDDNPDGAIFYKGIFMSGNASKGAIVKKVLETQQPNNILFFDDRAEQVDSVAKACQGQTNYTGIVFRAVDNLPKEDFNLGAFDYQVGNLLRSGDLLAAWVPYREALKNEPGANAAWSQDGWIIALKQELALSRSSAPSVFAQTASSDPNRSQEKSPTPSKPSCARQAFNTATSALSTGCYWMYQNTPTAPSWVPLPWRQAETTPGKVTQKKLA